jgi:hypothetical protein
MTALQGVGKTTNRTCIGVPERMTLRLLFSFISAFVVLISEFFGDVVRPCVR